VRKNTKRSASIATILGRDSILDFFEYGPEVPIPQFKMQLKPNLYSVVSFSAEYLSSGSL